MNKIVSDWEKSKLNPGLSAILSFIYNGLGQLYNGQIGKGLFIIALSSAGIFLSILGVVLLGHYFLAHSTLRWELSCGSAALIVGILSLCLIGPYSIIDAYNYAKKRLNET